MSLSSDFDLGMYSTFLLRYLVNTANLACPKLCSDVSPLPCQKRKERIKSLKPALLTIFSISVNDSSILPWVQDKILGVILPCVSTVKITYKEPDHVSSPQLLEQRNKSMITAALWPVPLLPLCPFQSNHNTAVKATLYKYKLDYVTLASFLLKVNIKVFPAVHKTSWIDFPLSSLTSSPTVFSLLHSTPPHTFPCRLLNIPGTKMLLTCGFCPCWFLGLEDSFSR